VIACLREVGIATPIVVAGGDRDAVRRVAEAAGARVVDNPDPDRGMLSSVRAGLAALPAGADAFVLWPVDHPGVSPSTVRRLADALVTPGARIALPLHAGRRGHPLLFHATLRPALEAAPDGVGARAVVHRYAAEVVEVRVDDDAVVTDLNTPADYAAALGVPFPGLDQDDTSR
jgi:nicotine blue oxidoreductase